MKKFYIYIISIIFISIYSNATAQDNLAGIYCDGIKADSITCWSFNEMKLVFPVKEREKWKKYDRIELSWDFNNKGLADVSNSLIFLPENIDDYLLPGAEFAVWTVMKDAATDRFTFISDKYSYKLKRADFGAYQKSCLTCKALENYSRYFHLEITGSFITGYSNENNGDITKKYGNSVTLYKSKRIPLYIESVNTFKSPQTAKTFTDPNCTIPGEKIDFTTIPAGGYVKNLELIMGSGNSASSVSDKNATSSAERTIITTNVVRNIVQLKSLDKTKSNYFEEKDGNGKLARAGYKDDDQYNGEVREYISGVLDQIVIYSNGLQDGIFLQYDKNGKLQIEATYKNGQLDGLFKTYSNGVLISTKIFVDSKEQ